MAKSERGLTLAVFAPLFDEAIRALELKNTEVSELTGAVPETVSKWRNAAPGREPPAFGKRRRFERVLGLPGGYLDGLVKVNWAELLTRRATEAGSSPVERALDAQDAPGLPVAWVTAKSFILEQLGGYERRGALVGASQVALWIAELERAVRAIGAAGAGAQTEAEHVGRHRAQAKKDVVEAASPPPRRAARRSARG